MPKKGPMFSIAVLLASVQATSVQHAACATSGDTLEITAETSAYVRTQPNADSDPVMVLLKGHQLVELSRRADWVYVEIVGSTGRRGWVHAALVDVTPTKRQTLECQGQDKDLATQTNSQIQWNSLSRVLPGGTLCFERSVTIETSPHKYLVHWPKANFQNVVVSHALTIPSGNYSTSIPVLDELEYGYLNSRLPTTVYRAHDEPFRASLGYESWRFAAYHYDSPARVQLVQEEADRQDTSTNTAYDEKWSSVVGSVYAGEEPIYLDLSIISGYRDISEGKRETFEYYYNIINEGDAVILDWSVAGSHVLAKYLDDNNIAVPIIAKEKEFTLNASGVAGATPIKEDSIVVIASIAGERALRLTVPAYVPAR